MASHYIPYFTTENGPKRSTVCGLWIDKRDHTAEPTCPDCQAWLADDAAQLQALQEMPPAPTNAVRDAVDRLTRDNDELFDRYARSGRR